MNTIYRVIRKLTEIPNLLLGNGFLSYSQVGEDRILEFLFHNLQIKYPTYLEIGTNHPVKGNNTFYFYLRGSKGVLVEPDPYYHNVIRSIRKQDKLYTCGIALNEAKEADFYIYPKKYSGWNTFSDEEVAVRKKEGINYEKCVKVPLRNVNSILEENFSSPPDFLGIDVEGLDEEIVRSYDFDKFAPKVICIEVIKYGDSKYVKKQIELIQYIENKGYDLFASTHVNAIFCKKSLL